MLFPIAMLPVNQLSKLRLKTFQGLSQDGGGLTEFIENSAPDPLKTAFRLESQDPSRWTAP